MFIFFECALLIERKSSTLNSLSFAAFLILLITPKALFEIGFQLSFVGVFSILWFYPVISQLLKSKYRLINYLKNILSVTISAQLGVTPFLLYYFGYISINGLLLSIILTPLIGLILILGLFLLCTYKIVFISKLISVISNFILKIFYYILDFSDSILFKIEYSKTTELELSLIFLILFFLTAFFVTKRLVVINNLMLTLILVFTVNYLTYKEQIEKECILYEKNGDINFCTRLRSELITTKIEKQHYGRETLYFAADKCIIKKKKGVVSKMKKPDLLYLNQYISDRELERIAPKKVLISSTIRFYEKKKLVLMLKLNKIPFHDYKKDGYFTF